MARVEEHLRLENANAIESCAHLRVQSSISHVEQLLF